jgi:low affinity Fe/Cu permease
MSNISAIWRLMSYFAPNCNTKMNFMSSSLDLTFGPITMYKWINGNVDRSIHILNLYVSTWLLIILVTLTLGWLLSILLVQGSQYHFP